MNLEIVKDGMKKALSRACRKKILTEYDEDTQRNVALGVDEGDATAEDIATFISDCRSEYQTAKAAVDAFDDLEILTAAKNDKDAYGFEPVKIKALVGKANIDECLVDFVNQYILGLEDYQSLAISSYLQGVRE